MRSPTPPRGATPRDPPPDAGVGAEGESMTLPRITVYRDRAGQYRWRFQARNGRVIADSSESYTRRHSAERAAYRFLGLARMRVEVVHDGPRKGRRRR